MQLSARFDWAEIQFLRAPGEPMDPAVTAFADAIGWDEQTLVTLALGMLIGALIGRAIPLLRD